LGYCNKRHDQKLKEQYQNAPDEDKIRYQRKSIGKIVT